MTDKTLRIGDLSGYDWGNINHAYNLYKATKTYNEFLDAVQAGYPDAEVRDYEIMWIAFNRVEEYYADYAE